LGVKSYTLSIILGQERSVTYFLGLEKICVFFWDLLISEQNFCCDQ